MERFDIYLRGFSASSEPAEEGLQRLFGIDRQRAIDLLKSLPRVVKRDVPEEYAVRYQLALNALGADFELRRSVIRPQQVIAIAGGRDDSEPLREEFEPAFTLPPPRAASSAAFRINATVLGAPPAPAVVIARADPADGNAKPNGAGFAAAAPAPAVHASPVAAAPAAAAPAAGRYPDTVVDPPRVFVDERTAPLASPLEPMAARSEATWAQSRPPPAPHPAPVQPAAATARLPAPAAVPQWSGFSDTLAEGRPAVRVSTPPRGPHATLPESRPPAAAIAAPAPAPAPVVAHAPVHAPAPLPREGSMVQLPRASLAPPASAAVHLRPPSMAIPLNSSPPSSAWAPIPGPDLNTGTPNTGPAAWDAGIDPNGRPGWFMDNTGVQPAPVVRDPAGYQQAGGATPQLRNSMPPTAARGPGAHGGLRGDERGSAPGGHAHAPGHPAHPGQATGHAAHPAQGQGQHPGRRPPSPTGAAAPAVGMNAQNVPRPAGPVPAQVGTIAGRELATGDPSPMLRWAVRVVIGLSLFVIVTTVRHIRALDSEVEKVLAGWGERRPPPEPVVVPKGDENAHPELGPPALEWMESDYHQFSNGDKDRVRGLVDKFVAAGAPEIHVGTITTVGMTQIAGELIVQLPADEVAHKAVLDVYEQYLQATFGGSAPPHAAPEGDQLHVTF